MIELIHKVKCLFGFHEPHSNVVVFYGKKFHLCKWCGKIIDDIER